MNSIVFTHFVTLMQGASHHDIALDRLGAYIDAEISSLEDLLDITGHEEAIDDIEILSGLHLAADASREDVGQMFEEARASLERLLELVRTIPFDGPLTTRIPSDFDAWLLWSRARLQNLVITLRHALVA